MSLLQITGQYGPQSAPILRSSSEQEPGSGFHPRDKNDKNDYGILGPSRSNKKIDPERQVPYGSYDLLVSNVAHQMKEKIMFKNKCSSFYVKLH